MREQTIQACAALGAALTLGVTVVTVAILCPEAFGPRPVVELAPQPGVPAYKIPVGQSYVIHRGVRYKVHFCNGQPYFIHNGIRYPVYY